MITFIKPWDANNFKKFGKLLLFLFTNNKPIFFFESSFCICMALTEIRTP